jgi:GNAT superfamily N-acetyltransferase
MNRQADHLMTELNINIRSATLADLDLLLSFIAQKAEFDGQLPNLRATPENLRHTLFANSPLAQVLLAEANKIAVGFALFYFTYSSFLAKPSLWIDDLFVRPSMRHQGIGTVLMEQIFQIARAKNCGRIEWTVATQNVPAIVFYQKHQAQILERIRVCRVEL